MVWRKFNPGCPCCDTVSICLIQSNVLDSDADLDDNFTLSDGDSFSYHEAPFEAIQISGADETATANTPHPQSPYPPRVQIEFYGDNIGSQPRIILGGKIVAQVTVGDDCSQLDILNEADDSEICQTLWMPGIDRNEWHRLIVCYDPDTGVVKATVTDLTTSQSYDLSCEYSGDALDATAAFGTGPAHVDNVYVRNFRFWRLWYCGDAPYTEDCHILGDAWDYYYELPDRKYCYQCNTSCEVASDDFTTMDDGDMPCDWDAGGTDWEIASGQATGNGAVCHKWDGTGGSYNVSATFDLGTLATVGDSVTVSLTNGGTTIGLTVTKEAARYKLEWVPSGLTISNSESTEGYSTTQPETVTLRICAGMVCGSGGVESVYKVVTVTGGSVCVSITQPTLSGHVDAGMTAFSIVKSRVMDPDCPECGCSVPCPQCVDGEWPVEWLIELSGVDESPVFDVYDAIEQNCYHLIPYLGIFCTHGATGEEMVIEPSPVRPVPSPRYIDFVGLSGLVNVPVYAESSETCESSITLTQESGQCDEVGDAVGTAVYWECTDPYYNACYWYCYFCGAGYCLDDSYTKSKCGAICYGACCSDITYTVKLQGGTTGDGYPVNGTYLKVELRIGYWGMILDYLGSPPTYHNYFTVRYYYGPVTTPYACSDVSDLELTYLDGGQEFLGYLKGTTWQGDAVFDTDPFAGSTLTLTAL